MQPDPDSKFVDWLDQLEARHLADLRFAEVRRGLQALSARYVHYRESLTSGAALDGAGKRAAFAVFYGPLHFLTVRHVVTELGAHRPAPDRILDLGCGSGAAGAAWALLAGPGSEISGIDLNPWAAGEAGWTWGRLGLRGRARRADVRRWPGLGSTRTSRGAILLAYTVNELPRDALAPLLERLLDAARRGARVLVLEPISKKPVPWWDSWADAFRGADGREDTWRFEVELPELLRRLDRAAGLDHRRLTARSLFL
ncbi:MAG: hypothetical protein GY716_00810 [bacterium]|nr:hypothetical protein [bacterium]